MRRVWFVVCASTKKLILSRTVYRCTLIFTYKWPQQNRNTQSPPMILSACMFESLSYFLIVIKEMNER